MDEETKDAEGAQGGAAEGVPAPAWARLVLVAAPFALALLVLLALWALGG